MKFQDIVEAIKKRILDKIERENQSDRQLTEDVYGEYVKTYASLPKPFDMTSTFDKGASKNFELLPAIHEDFLADKSKGSLLITGEAGSGKSWAMRELTKELWAEYSSHQTESEEMVIPLWIPLISINDPKSNLLENYLGKYLGLLDTEIREFFEAKPNLLLILDGYDEIKCGDNLYDSNRFSEFDDMQIIITCRKEYLANLPKPYSDTFDISGRGHLEYRIAPFSTAQIEEYVDNYTKNEVVTKVLAQVFIPQQVEALGKLKPILDRIYAFIGPIKKNTKTVVRKKKPSLPVLGGKEEMDLNITEDVSEDTSLIIKAIMENDVERVKILINKGEDINKYDIYGNNAFSVAITNGNVDIVRVLLDNGIDIDQFFKDGFTALYSAAAKRREDLIELLLKRGAKLPQVPYSNKLVNVLLYISQIPLLRGDLKTTKRCLMETIQLFPTCYAAHQNLGCCYNVEGNYDQANLSFEKACLLNPYSSTYCEYGHFLVQQKKWTRAITWLEKSLESQDGSELIYGLLERGVVDIALREVIDKQEKHEITINAKLFASYLLIKCHYKQHDEERMIISISKFKKFANNTEDHLLLETLNNHIQHYINQPNQTQIFEEPLRFCSFAAANQQERAATALELEETIKHPLEPPIKSTEETYTDLNEEELLAKAIKLSLEEEVVKTPGIDEDVQNLEETIELPSLASSPKTPLTIAVKKGKVSRLLLSYDALSLSTGDNLHSDAEAYARFWDRTEIVKLIVAFKAKQNKPTDILASHQELENVAFKQTFTPHSRYGAEAVATVGDLDDLYSILTNLRTIEYPAKKDNTWATSDGINQALEHWLKDIAHVVNSELSSVKTPVNSEEGARDYAKKIVGFKTGGEEVTNGFVHVDGGMLKKPVVMVLNTQVGVASHGADTQAQGGSHWQACVILPKYYKPLFAAKLDNENEIIFYLDSLYPNVKIPAAFKEILTKGASYSFNSDKGKREQEVIHEVTHEIPALCPNAIFKDGLITNQQDGGSDCGWWTLYNALMVVFTGRTDYLFQFTGPSREPAYKLRSLFQNLDSQFEPFQSKDLTTQGQKPLEGDDRLDYKFYLRRIPNLIELITNPFILTIVMASIADIIKEHEEFAKSKPEQKRFDSFKLTRDRLYEIFTNKYFLRQAKKLHAQATHSMELNKGISELFKIQYEKHGNDQLATSIALVKAFTQYTTELAYTLYQHRRSYAYYIPYGRSTVMAGSVFSRKASINDEWTAIFFDKNKNPFVEIYLMACPIRVDGGRYSFWHDSLREYFGAKHLFDGALTDAWLMSGENLNLQPIWKYNPLGFDFLIDLVSRNEDFKKTLIDIVLASKYEPEIWKASANAITILHFANFSIAELFRETSLQRVRIGGEDSKAQQHNTWGALLPGVVLDGMDVSYADLRHVDFTQAYLNGVNFRNSCLDDVILTQRNSLPGDLYCVSEEHSLIAIAENTALLLGRGCCYTRSNRMFRSYDLSVYADNEKIFQYRGVGNIDKLAINPNGRELAFCEFKIIKVSSFKWGIEREIVTSIKIQNLFGRGVTRSISIFSGIEQSSVRPHEMVFLTYASETQLIYMYKNNEESKCIIRILDLSNNFDILEYLVEDVAILDFTTQHKPYYISNIECLVVGRADEGLTLISKHDNKWHEQKIRASKIGTSAVIVADVKGRVLGIISQEDEVLLYDLANNIAVASHSLSSYIEICIRSPSSPLHHLNKPTALSFSKDETVLYVGTDNGNIEVWNIADWKDSSLIGIFATSSSRVDVLERFLGCLIYSGDNHIINFLDLTILERLHFNKKFTARHFTRIAGIAFSPDDKNCVTISVDGSIKVWNAQTGNIIKTFQQGSSDYNANIAYLNNGIRMLLIGVGYNIRIWGAKAKVYDTLAMKDTVSEHTLGLLNSSIRSAVQKVVGVEKANEKFKKEVSIEEAKEILRDAKFQKSKLVEADENEYIDLGYASGLMLVLEDRNELILASNRFSNSAEESPIHIINLDSSLTSVPGLNLSRFFNIPNTPDKFNFEDVKEIPYSKGVYNKLSYSSGKQYLAANMHTMSNPFIFIWNLNNPSQRPIILNHLTNAMDISSDGTKLAGAKEKEYESEEEGDIWIWNLDKLDLSLTRPTWDIKEHEIGLERDFGILEWQFHPDPLPKRNLENFRRRVGNEKFIELKDYTIIFPYGNVTVIHAHHDRINSLKYTVDGKYLASGASDRTVCIWESGDSLKLSLKYDVGTSPSALLWSKNGRKLVVGGKDGSVRLWNLNLDEACSKPAATLLWQAPGYLNTQNINISECRGISEETFTALARSSLIEGRQTLVGLKSERPSDELIRSRSAQKPVDSHQIEAIVNAKHAKQYVISDDQWLLSIVRKRTGISEPGSEKHVFILIQGLQKQGNNYYLTITELHFLREGLLFGPFDKAKIEIREKSVWDLEEMAKNNALECKHYPVNVGVATQLIENAEEERNRLSLYSYTGAYTLPGNNCLSWCIERFKDVGVEVEDRNWVNMFYCHPKKFLPERRMTDEELASQQASKQSFTPRYSIIRMKATYTRNRESKSMIEQNFVRSSQINALIGIEHAKQYVISDEQWLLSVIREKSSISNQCTKKQVFILVQGLQKYANGYHLIIKELHFVRDSSFWSCDRYKIEICEKSAWDLEAMANCISLVCKHYEVSVNVAKKLIENSEEEQKHLNLYSYFGADMLLGHNCLSWCIRRLEDVGVVVEDKDWVEMFYHHPEIFLPERSQGVQETTDQQIPKQSVKPRCSVM